MRKLSIHLAALLAVAGASSAHAQSDPKPAEPAKPAKPVTDREVSMGDAVLTPASDLNIKKDEIPPQLIAAQTRPYDLTGLRQCAQISAAVTEFDAMLGPDLDMPAAERERITAGRVAQAAVGAFIPFRGLIREISGANAHERKLDAAIVAGSARRAFLKGYGEAKGCKYPARSVSYLPVVAVNAKPVVQKTN